MREKNFIREQIDGNPQTRICKSFAHKPKVYLEPGAKSSMEIFLRNWLTTKSR